MPAFSSNIASRLAEEERQRLLEQDQLRATAAAPQPTVTPGGLAGKARNIASSVASGQTQVPGVTNTPTTTVTPPTQGGNVPLEGAGFFDDLLGIGVPQSVIDALNNFSGSVTGQQLDFNNDPNALAFQGNLFDILNKNTSALSAFDPNQFAGNVTRDLIASSGREIEKLAADVTSQQSAAGRAGISVGNIGQPTQAALAQNIAEFITEANLAGLDAANRQQAQLSSNIINTFNTLNAARFNPAALNQIQHENLQQQKVLDAALRGAQSEEDFFNRLLELGGNFLPGLLDGIFGDGEGNILDAVKNLFGFGGDDSDFLKGIAPGLTLKGLQTLLGGEGALTDVLGSNDPFDLVNILGIPQTASSLTNFFGLDDPLPENVDFGSLGQTEFNNLFDTNLDPATTVADSVVDVGSGGGSGAGAPPTPPGGSQGLELLDGGAAGESAPASVAEVGENIVSSLEAFNANQFGSSTFQLGNLGGATFDVLAGVGTGLFAEFGGLGSAAFATNLASTGVGTFTTGAAAAPFSFNLGGLATGAIEGTLGTAAAAGGAGAAGAVSTATLLAGLGVFAGVAAVPLAMMLFGGKKPSDKGQGARLVNGVVQFAGGLSGDKFSQENKDAAIALTSGVRDTAIKLGIDPRTVDAHVTVGNRDGIRFEMGDFQYTFNAEDFNSLSPTQVEEIITDILQGKSGQEVTGFEKQFKRLGTNVNGRTVIKYNSLSFLGVVGGDGGPSAEGDPNEFERVPDNPDVIQEDNFGGGE